MYNWRDHQPAPERGTRRGRLTARPRGRQGSTRGRQMEYIASVSRSSGLEKDGDALKDFKVQEEYREFIQNKLNDVRGLHSPESEFELRQRLDTQENIMILFRKLREGLVSSQRSDQFALEVYETSLYLAVLFDSPRQITSIISRLIPDIYLILSSAPRNRLPTIVISLLHHLVSSYPSQSTFYQHLHSLPSLFLPADSEAHSWLSSLSSSLRSRNYVKFEELTRPLVFSRFVDVEPSLASLSISPQSSCDLAKKAMFSLVDALRVKARETTWSVIRSAYRELSCHAEVEETRDWLTRSLALHSVIPDTSSVSVDEWLDKQTRLGHVRPKEGVEGKWIVCKLR